FRHRRLYRFSVDSRKQRALRPVHAGDTRTLVMQPQPFALERYFARYEFTTKYLLCASDPESMPISELLAFEPDAAERFSRTWLGYTESLGATELREAIGTLYPV